MQNILTANQDIDVAASAYDVMTDGIEQAIKAAGIKTKIKLIGSGGGSRAIAAVCSKRWFGTISAVPQTEGQLAAKYAHPGRAREEEYPRLGRRVQAGARAAPCRRRPVPASSRPSTRRRGRSHEGCTWWWTETGGGGLKARPLSAAT